MRPEERAAITRRMNERAEATKELREQHQASVDRLEFRDALRRVLRPHEHDLDRVVGLPDEEARHWVVAEMPLASSAQAGSLYQRNVVPAPRTHVLVAPGEALPEDSIATRTVAELRSDFMVQQLRVRRIVARNPMMGRQGGTR